MIDTLFVAKCWKSALNVEKVASKKVKNGTPYSTDEKSFAKRRDARNV